MKRYLLKEDVPLQKLNVRLSSELIDKMNRIGTYYLQNLPHFDDTCQHFYIYIDDREIIIFYHFEQNVYRTFQVAILIDSIDSKYDVYECDIICASGNDTKRIVKEMVNELLA